jgi:hypothetical protein
MMSYQRRAADLSRLRIGIETSPSLLQHVCVSLEEEAELYWLGHRRGEEFIEAATQLLVAGYDSEALRRTAGMTAADDPRDVRDMFRTALDELGDSLRDRDEALTRWAARLARRVLHDEIRPEDLRAAFDDIDLSFTEIGRSEWPDGVYPFLFLAFLWAHRSIEDHGGVEALRAAAIALDEAQT